VVNSADQPDLAPVSGALRDSPAFLAGWLGATPHGGQLLVDRLRLEPSSLQRLLVCRAPRPRRFAADVTAVAEYVEVTPEALAGALREAASLAAFANRPSQPVEADHAVGLLAAAHDTAAEQLPRTAGSFRMRQLADATWRAVPEQTRESRDIEAALAWSAPVAVVSLPQLVLVAVNRWLEIHQVPRLTTSGTERLQGLLLAWRGHGLVFIDGTLDTPERRFAVAHEHGHFLLDYAEPRRRILAEAPDLLDVVDGHRPPTAADRARAALARVPLGVHSHLLERDTDGGAAHDVVAAEDDASLYAQELLAPWDATLRLLRTVVSSGRPYSEMLRLAARAIADEFVIPPDPAVSRATAALEALGVRRSFFER